MTKRLKKRKSQGVYVKEKSQIFSLDVMVAVGLFMLAAIMLYYFIGSDKESELNDLVYDEGTQIPELLAAPQNQSLSFVHGGEVDPERLDTFVRMNYNQTREALGIVSDFCFYFEDEQGHVVNLSQGMISYGSEKAQVGSKPCGQW
jgi:hypothetical protein